MSHPEFTGSRAGVFPTIPSGVTVATFPDYGGARDAVDRLAAQGFPVQKINIIGDDLKSVERVTGAMSWGRAALSGMVSGIWFGFFLGMLMVLWSPSSGSAGAYMLIAVMMGAAFGIFTGVVSYAFTRRRQNFTSIRQVVASTYIVIASPDVASEAMRVLGTTPRM